MFKSMRLSGVVERVLVAVLVKGIAFVAYWYGRELFGLFLRGGYAECWKQ